MHPAQLTTISRKHRPVITTDPSVVESVAREFLDSLGAEAFTHYRPIRAAGRSVLSLFPEPKRGARPFKKPLTPQALGKILPGLKNQWLYPDHPQNTQGVSRGWTVGVKDIRRKTKRFIMTATWVSNEENA